MSDLEKQLESHLEKQIVEVTGLFRSGAMTESVYHKCLLCFSVTALGIGDEKQAIDLLQSIPLSYFERDHQQHMREDPHFAEISHQMATFLVKTGYAHVGPKIVTNIPGASA